MSDDAKPTVSFIKQATVVFTLRVMLVPATLAADILLARTLGTEGKGFVAILRITPMMFALLASGGPGFALNYLGHKNRSDLARLFSTAVSLTLVVACSVGFLLLIDLAGSRSTLYRSLPIALQPAVFISVALILFEALFSLAVFLAMTADFPIVPGQMRLLRRTTFLVGVVAVVALVPACAESRVTLIIVGDAIALVLGVAYCLKRVKIAWVPPTYGIRKLALEAVRAGPVRATERIQLPLGLVLLGILADGSSAGIYSVASSVGNVVLFLAGSTGTVLFARSISTDRDLHRQTLRLMLPIATTVALTIGAASMILIPLLWGPEFSPSVRTLAVMLPGMISLALIQVATPYMVQIGESRAVSVALVFGLGVNIIVNLLAIPALGADGAALASTASLVVAMLTMVSWLGRTENRSFREILIADHTDFIKLKRGLRQAMRTAGQRFSK